VLIDAEIERLSPRCPIPVTVRRADGTTLSFVAIAAVETGAEVETLRAGGILPLILQKLMQKARQAAASVA
jgi:aconitate hydratase